SIYIYDDAGNVIAQSNALGETTLYEYNDIYLETKRTDPLGNETIWTYDNFGNQLTETDALGNTTTSTYNKRGEILTQTDANGDTTISNEYVPDNHNTAGQLSKVTDALSNTIEYTWSAGQASNQDTVVFSTGFKDARGNKYNISSISSGTSRGLSGSTTDLNGLKIETTYDDVSTPTVSKQIITDDNGNMIQEITTTFEYNANGDVIKTTDNLGNFILTEYNQLKRISATVDANGNRTEYTFDDLGNAIKISFADGTTELATFDDEGNQLTSTDRAGRVTKTIYDVANRPIETILPDGTPLDDSDNPRALITYNAIGQMVSITDPLGNVTQYEYDALGKRTKTIDALGNTTTVTFDSNGIITQKTDALGRITKYETNAIGSIVKIIFPDSTANDDNDNLFTTKIQDELMRKVAETDLAGKITQYEYSNGSNLLAIIDPIGQRTEYTYDQRGNKRAQTDANGNATTWAYDEFNRMVLTTLPDGQTKSKTYDAIGNVLTKTDFNGNLTSFEYNNLNQLVKTTFADNTIVTSTYTAIGKIASITQSQGTTSYQYDAQDRLTRIDYPDSNFIAYGYDLNGNRTQLQTASQTVNYTFDVLNRLATVTDINGTTSYTYDAVGNRVTQISANGIIATYSYDPLNRLTSLVHTDASNNVIASYQYTLGSNGNRQRIEEATGRVVDYSYDDLYKLIVEDINDPINGNHSTEFAYDAVGNRLQQNKDGIITTYTYNLNDLLLTETESTIITSYTYDNNGNTLTKSIDGTLDTSYSYNKENQMIQAITSSSTIDYDYDASGIKYYQNVDGAITNYLIDPNRSYAQVIEEQDSSNSVQVIYLYGDDLISQARAGATHTFGYDGLGSTRILTDTNGTVQNSYGYQAFGEQDYQFGSIENSYLFTGEQYDNNIGFYYLRARYYNPDNGRFTQRDAFPGMEFEPATLHKYLYTANNPVNFIDPSGNTFLGGLATAGRVLGVLTAYGIAAYNVIERVESGIAIYQGVAGLYAAWNKMQAAGLSFNIEGDREFNEAMQNWDTALYVLSKNMGKIFHDMAGNKKKRDEVQQFVKKPNTLMLIYGPTPSANTPTWLPLNTRVKIGRLSIGKKKKKIMLELGRKGGSGGRMIGMGHAFKSARNGENTQWWRMDYHSDHGAGSFDWKDGDYHFHTLKASNNK
ncbi:MAG: RHS repeat protein, partial [Alcanivoracaceae bacterium]|nr:RHS repeat protein [Alcanivoracaceae bacterium]